MYILFLKWFPFNLIYSNEFHSLLFCSPQAALVDATDDYNVEEEDLNMVQAQRMVQKAIHRTKKK